MAEEEGKTASMTSMHDFEISAGAFRSASITQFPYCLHLLVILLRLSKNYSALSLPPLHQVDSEA